MPHDSRFTYVAHAGRLLSLDLSEFLSSSFGAALEIVIF